MAYENLTLERDDLVAVVTLNRPEKLNAIDRNLHLEMMDACAELRDDDRIRVVIFTGAGRGFCSGADLTADRSRPDNPSRAERLDEYNWVGRQALMIYRDLDKPTIAAVNGVAAGAGMGLALACDMRIGCENTRFKTVFIERSLSPDSGLSWFLPRIVGVSRAMDLVYTSRRRGRQRGVPSGPARPNVHRREPAGGCQGTGPPDRLLAARRHADVPPRHAPQPRRRP